MALTAEDAAIFDQRHDSMDAQYLYEAADESGADYMLSLMRQRARFDLAPIALRIGG